jgi:Tfp pilus assembly protein PilF
MRGHQAAEGFPMLKRFSIIISLTLVMVIAVEPLQTVHGIMLTHAEILALEAADEDARNGQSKLEHGGGFVKALGAPFRALGRLFGGGKKKKSRVERITQKDIEKFEAAKPIQVNQTQRSEIQAEATKGMLLTSASSLVQPAVKPLSAPVTVVTPASLAGQHLERGRGFLNTHDLNGAIAELSAAVSLDPKLAEASSLLGVAYWRKGLRGQAQNSFEAAIKAQKDDPQILNNLGYLLYEMGEYDDAAKQLKRAAKLAPQDARILNNLALTQAERGNYDDAYKAFARALGDYTGHVNLAVRLQRHGQYKKAIKHLEKALALKPNSPDVLARLADLYDSEEKPEKAHVARATLQTLRTLADAAPKP